jgi:sugar O-acyltransferase (sialic acid O-acetyltransferase NeuD family)
MGTLAILGAGGHGRVVADCAEAAGWTEISLFDDRPSPETREAWPIGGAGADLIARLSTFQGVVVGIGDNAARVEWQRRLAASGGHLVSLVHPRATVSSYATLGVGSVVFAGAVVNIGARLGQAVIVNTGATVDHDCDLADGVHVSPGAHLAGGVRIGGMSWVGIGAVIREGITIGQRVRIGAGAVVVESVGDDLTVVGNPARPLEKRTHA